MASFFRRNKPTTPDSSRTSRYSLEELAAAFPTAPSAATPASPVEAVPNAEPEREAAATPVVAPVTPAPAGGEPAAPSAPIPPQITAAPADQLAQEIAARTGQAQSIAAVPSAPAAPAAPAPTALQALPDPIPPSAPVVVPPPVVAQPQTVPTPPPAVPAQPVSPLQSAAPAVVAPPVAVPPASTPAPAAATPAGAPPISAAPAGKPGWRERLRNSTFARSFGGLFSRNPKLDDDLLDEIETALITADVGIGATTALIDGLRKRMKSREFVDAQAMFKALRADLIALLQPVSKPLVIDRSLKPFVVLTVGVNGVGKTTTIGKLAKRFKDEGNSLMLAAGDTFRAAAVAQLQAWGDSNGVAVIAQGQNADAASVAFDALQAAKARGTDVLIADTAGRLHTQTGLMNELGKIRRVLGKIDAAAPHEVLMVIDGTTGQNAISQLRQFHAAVGVTGLVVTKLDGTAKGGVVFALAREFNIPIRFAGIGERPEDLRVFDPVAFVDALLPDALGG
ncbi:signal recognition particle-docking protein FtsY [Xanthomonas cissicola]|uniref:Signal recognition particle receptor FtsY n=1 Tax=Xanthomonas cissicola TaxID=86186 RepID=A0ABX3LXE9_9XANT|nr:signal recognition particle-docking protein FtsY [Xanthomonas cissicola]KAB0536395.1 signal recognition particle-docking protein FtsY [Xanthomonas cissicola]OOW60475.1 cell division protein FtsY [Xanthomonas cissicola]